MTATHGVDIWVWLEQGDNKTKSRDSRPAAMSVIQSYSGLRSRSMNPCSSGMVRSKRDSTRRETAEPPLSMRRRPSCSATPPQYDGKELRIDNVQSLTQSFGVGYWRLAVRIRLRVVCTRLDPPNIRLSRRSSTSIICDGVGVDTHRMR